MSSTRGSPGTSVTGARTGLAVAFFGAGALGVAASAPNGYEEIKHSAKRRACHGGMTARDATVCTPLFFRGADWPRGGVCIVASLTRAFCIAGVTG